MKSANETIELFKTLANIGLWPSERATSKKPYGLHEIVVFLGIIIKHDFSRKEDDGLPNYPKLSKCSASEVLSLKIVEMLKTVANVRYAQSLLQYLKPG